MNPTLNIIYFFKRELDEFRQEITSGGCLYVYLINFDFVSLKQHVKQLIFTFENSHFNNKNVIDQNKL